MTEDPLDPDVVELERLLAAKRALRGARNQRSEETIDSRIKGGLKMNFFDRDTTRIYVPIVDWFRR